MSETRGTVVVALLVFLANSSGALAQTWDGGGDGVNWSDAANWSPDIALSSSSSVVFGNQTTNLSTTVDTPQLITRLRVDQSTPGVSQTLTLGSDLLLTASDPLRFNANLGGLSTLPNAGAFKLDLNGKWLSLSSQVAGSTRFMGTYTFDTAGSTIRSSNVVATGGVTFSIGQRGDQPAVVDVTADGVIGRDSNSQFSNVAGPFNVFFGVGNSVVVSNDAQLTLRFAMRSPNQDAADLVVENMGSIAVAAGAAVRLERTGVNMTEQESVADIVFSNTSFGVVSHAGRIITLPLARGNTELVNAGTWQVTGTAAAIVDQRADVTGAVAPTFVNAAGGELTGAGVDDRLAFQSTNVVGELLSVTSLGTVSPGAGGGGTGLTSVGRLELAAMNLALSGTGARLALDIGGTSNGQFDVLSLAKGDATAPPTLTIGPDAILQLSYVNGFVPIVGYSLPILVYGDRAGSFDLMSNLVVTGATGFAADPANYSISYGDGSASLVLVPEPASFLPPLVVAGLILARVRARARTT